MDKIYGISRKLRLFGGKLVLALNTVMILTGKLKGLTYYTFKITFYTKYGPARRLAMPLFPRSYRPKSADKINSILDNINELRSELFIPRLINGAPATKKKKAKKKTKNKSVQKKKKVVK